MNEEEIRKIFKEEITDLEQRLSLKSGDRIIIRQEFAREVFALWQNEDRKGLSDLISREI